jgi:hypothetical protein
VDDLRKRVKEKWSTVELYLPSVSPAKFTPVMNMVQPGMVSAAYEGNRPSKVKVKLASDLILGIPVLSGTDPEEILKFFFRANQISELKLIPDSDFMMLLCSHPSWDELLMSLTLALNLAWHESSAATPASLFLGRDLNHPLGLKWKLLDLDLDNDPKCMEEYWDRALSHLRRARSGCSTKSPTPPIKKGTFPLS